jgi:hypothetical protein
MRSFNWTVTLHILNDVMTIGSNYPTPVMVNGFLCRNCTDVAYAKQHIDPAHPKSGPYGIDAKDDPTVKNAPSSTIIFGGNLASLNAKPTTTATSDAAESTNGEDAAGTISAAATGSQLDVSA